MFNKKFKKKLLPLAVITTVAFGSLGATFSTVDAKEKVWRQRPGGASSHELGGRSRRRCFVGPA